MADASEATQPWAEMLAAWPGQAIAALLVEIPSTLAYGMGFFLLTLLLTRFWPVRNGRTNFTPIHPPEKFINKEFRTEVSFFLFNLVFASTFVKTLVVWGIGHAIAPFIPPYPLAGYTAQLPWTLQVLLALLIIDFASFLMHRFLHRFLWYYHAVHHAAEEITWLTALRLHPFEKLIFVCGSAVAFHILGFDTEAFVLAFFIDGLYNMFVHSNLRFAYPKPLCYILGSPAYHRWHHARDETEAFDKNFATIFPFLDILGGSYYHPEGKLPSAYGIYQRPEDPALPCGFWGQMVTPFTWHFRVLKKRFNWRKKR